MGTYYIDPIGGSDTNDGLSEATAVASMDYLCLSRLGMTLTPDTTQYNAGNNTGFEHTINIMRGTVMSRGFLLPCDTAASNTLQSLTICGANNAILIVLTGGASVFVSGSPTPMLDSNNRRTSINLRNIRVYSDCATFYQIRDAFWSGSAYYNNLPAFTWDNCVIRGSSTLIETLYPSYSWSGVGPSNPTIIRNVIADGAITIAPPFGLVFEVIDSIIADPSRVVELGSYSYAPTPTAILAKEGAILPQPAVFTSGSPTIPVVDYLFSPSTAGGFTGDPPWINDPSYAAGVAQVSQNQILIASGPSARVLSPVYVYTEGISFSTTCVEAIEDESLPSGAKEVVDSTPLDSVRTIDIRVSDTVFDVTDPSPAWVAVNKNSSHVLFTGKYVQYRITLTTEGV